MPRHIQPQIRPAFVEQAVRSNWALIKVISVFAVGVELFNIIRVIFYSPSGLTTPNNWTYFAFYASLFLAAAVFLCADALGSRRLALKVRYSILKCAGSFFVLWQALFAAFDLSTSLSVGKISGVATMVAFAALFLMEPLYAVVNITAGYLIMLAYLVTLNDPGAVLNYVIMGMMTLVIYFARYHGICIELTQAGRIEDINRALEETEEQFRLSSEQYDLLLRQGNLIAFRWDIKEDVIRFSPAWKDVFDLPQQIDHIRDKVETGRRLNDQQKKTLLHCLTEAYATAAYQKQEVLLPVKGGKERWFEVHIAFQHGRDGLPVKGGKERWFEVHIAFQHGRDGQPVVGVGLLFDIMDQKDRILELEREVSLDAFTRTLNKTALESYGTRRLAQLEPRQQMVLLILDMDDFKTINDTYGHQAGDHVLVQLASLMNALAPARCRVGRLGGDEFAAIFDPPCTRYTAENYAARLIEAVRRIEWEGKPLPAACSIGIAACPGGGAYDALYAAADKALYEAKRQGKGRYRFAGSQP